MKSINETVKVSILENGKTGKLVLEDIAKSQFQEDAFYIMDLRQLVKQYRIWTETLPTIKPYYAVKCNDSLIVLQVLAALGANFDCASKNEIARVLNIGVPPERIIFANPVKQASHIRYAEKVGVDLMTFDNNTELFKIKEIHPNARLVLRITADSLDSQCPAMGMKFGVSPGKAVELIKVAASLDLNLVGISFHVGSGCREYQAYRRALIHAKDVYNQCKALGFNIDVIDIGGGFTNEQFPLMAESIMHGLEETFHFNSGLNIIAEPGRFFVADAYTLATRIHSMRIDKSNYMYYINDGLYGSFNCLLYDKATVTPIPLKKYNGQLYKSTIWGPTCDSLDLITKDYLLPKMSLGDWIVFNSMGAYTLSASTGFNGFEPPKVHHVIDEHTWELFKHVLPDFFTFDETPFWFRSPSKEKKKNMF